MSNASMARTLMKTWLATMVLAPMAHAAALRTLADVWGGSGNGNIAQGCTTYGPIPDLGALVNGGGWRVLGGNVACGYTGVISDETAATGPLLASSPFVTPAAAHSARHVVSLDGSLSSLGTASGSAGVSLSVRQATGPVLGLGRLSIEGSDPAPLTAIDGSPSTRTLGSGEASGSGDVGSTIHMPFFGGVDLPVAWGTPWDLQVMALRVAQGRRTGTAGKIGAAVAP